MTAHDEGDDRAGEGRSLFGSSTISTFSLFLVARSTCTGRFVHASILAKLGESRALEGASDESVNIHSNH